MWRIARVPELHGAGKQVMASAEQRARDMLERMGVKDAQAMSSGDVVELANVLANTDIPCDVRLKDVHCPQCGQAFQLVWRDYDRDRNYASVTPTLLIRGCPSGGIYDVLISCPHCNYEEPL